MTSVSDAVRGVARLAIDTAPFIYLVERHPVHGPVVREIVSLADAGKLVLVTSVLTLTEVLTHPLRVGASEVAAAYRDVLLQSPHLAMMSIDEKIAEDAARLRALHRLRTPDALQLAVARAAGCDAFLTNDTDLSQVSEIRVIQVSDLHLP